VCLKPLKSGPGIGIKAEFALGEAHAHGQLLAGSGREKRAKGDEDRGTVTDVERKGIKEFVVFSVRVHGSTIGPVQALVLFFWGFFFSFFNDHRTSLSNTIHSQ